jgi:hypothetical protein
VLGIGGVGTGSNGRISHCKVSLFHDGKKPFGILSGGGGVYG